jgi:hypothetical protein
MKQLLIMAVALLAAHANADSHYFKNVRRIEKNVYFVTDHDSPNSEWTVVTRYCYHTPKPKEEAVIDYGYDLTSNQNKPLTVIFVVGHDSETCKVETVVLRIARSSN